jgi:hypothetical protein
MRGCTALAAIGLAASGCIGGAAPHPVSNATSRTTPATRTAHRLGDHGRRSVEAPDFLHARMPASWYGQTYATTNIIITSFPIHTAKQAYGPIPAGGVAIQVFDMPPASRVACGGHPNPHGRLRLGGYEPNYEAFGAAYRIEFYDHSHHVLVFISFGDPASSAARREAVAVLNSIHADPRPCPIPALRL